MIETYSLYLSVRCIDYAKTFNNPFELNHIFDPTFQDEFKVMCFSQSSDHPILWSHGDSFKGMCIEYDLNHYDGDTNLNCFKVQYEDDPTRFSLPSYPRLTRI